MRLQSNDPGDVPLQLFGRPTARRAWSSLVDGDLHAQPDLDAFGATDIGARKDNQDQFLVAELERGLHVRSSSVGTDDGTTVTDAPQGHIFAVADGVGGLADGDVASAVAIDAVAHYALTAMPWILAAERDADKATKGLRRAVVRAQERIEKVARRRGRSSEMASTFTMVYVTWPQAYVAHVGDSRCYLKRGREIEQLTHDQTLAEELRKEGVASDKLEGSRAEHILVSVLGGPRSDLEVELMRAELEEGDQLVLCTDGLTKYVSIDELDAFLCQGQSAEEIGQRLIETANERGGQDNITVVVSRF